MNAMSFLDDMKKYVWKIKVTYLDEEEDDGDKYECFSGVCIREDGMILTHAYDNENVSKISAYDADELEHSASPIVHNHEDGLALLRVGKKKDNYNSVGISERTEYTLSDKFHAILYQREAFNPICLEGFLANVGKDMVGDSDGDSDGERGEVRFLYEGKDNAYPEKLGPDVPLLQIGGLGATDECYSKTKTFRRFNFHGFKEGRGCPLFHGSPALAGIVLFQKSSHDFAIHAKFIKSFASKYLPPLVPPADGKKRKRR